MSSSQLSDVGTRIGGKGLVEFGELAFDVLDRSFGRSIVESNGVERLVRKSFGEGLGESD